VTIPEILFDAGESELEAYWTGQTDGENGPVRGRSRGENCAVRGGRRL